MGQEEMNAVQVEIMAALGNKGFSGAECIGILEGVKLELLLRNLDARAFLEDMRAKIRAQRQGGE